MTSYYDVLGIGVDADRQEVRRAYYRKAQLLHPDRYATASGSERQRAEAEMKAVNEAWTTLRNAEARHHYDAALGLIDTHEEHGDERLGDEDPCEETEPQQRPSGFPRRGVAVALVLIIGVVASVIAAAPQSDDQAPRWKASEIAELRFAALNAGLTAPQAECFVQAITSRYGPSEPVDRAVQQILVGTCR